MREENYGARKQAISIRLASLPSVSCQTGNAPLLGGVAFYGYGIKLEPTLYGGE
jgi:hypothetical protein